MRWDTPHLNWDSGAHWDRSVNPIGTGARTTMFKLLIGFEKLGQEQFLSRAQGIKVALTSEPALTVLPEPWPAPYPSRVQLTTAYTAFETAYDTAQDGGRTAVDTRDQNRVTLTGLLKDLAPYFESMAKAASDITILDATGYNRRLPSSPIPTPLPAPLLKVKRSLMSGVIVINGKRVRGASSYETQYCIGDPAVEANWKHGLTTSGCLHIELTGLTPGQLYYLRLRAVGSNGPGAWSDVASLMAA